MPKNCILPLKAILSSMLLGWIEELGTEVNRP